VHAVVTCLVVGLPGVWVSPSSHPAGPSTRASIQTSSQAGIRATTHFRLVLRWRRLPSQAGLTHREAVFRCIDRGRGPAARRQAGPVWFLSEPAPDSPSQRVCAIPEHTSLLIPLVNGEWSVAEAQLNNGKCLVPASLDGTSDAALRACARALMDLVTTRQADLDGRPVEDLHAFRCGLRLIRTSSIRW
jgi:hypothetical protein